MAQPVSIVSARFEDLVSIGLRKLIAGDPNLTLVASDVELDRLEDVIDPREADVLALLQRGMTNAQIAHELSIGLETVRTHARNIYRKLGISTRRALARLAHSPVEA